MLPSIASLITPPFTSVTQTWGLHSPDALQMFQIGSRTFYIPFNLKSMVLAQPWPKQPQLCCSGEPNTVLQNSALKVVYSRTKQRGGKRRKREGSWQCNKGEIIKVLLCCFSFSLRCSSRYRQRCYKRATGAHFCYYCKSFCSLKHEGMWKIKSEKTDKNKQTQTPPNKRQWSEDLIKALTWWPGRAFCKVGWISHCCLQARSKYCKTSPMLCSEQRKEAGNYW